MMVKRERQVKSKRWAAEEEETWMKEERKTDVMRVERQAADVELTFEILDWIQIAFIFVSDW